MSDVMRVDAGWPLQPDLCHADLDLLTFIATRADDRRALRVFHMGPGLHHTVGFAIAATQVGHVLSLTNSREELDAWADRATIDPEVRRRYVCQFGDIREIQPWMLPAGGLTLATLFHIGEYPTDEYDAHHDRHIMAMFADTLRPDGHLLFYRGSSAWDRMAPLVDELGDARLKREEDHGPLVVFRRL